jgi:hypothetical protein
VIDYLLQFATVLANGGLCGIALLLAAIGFANVLFLLLVSALTGDRMSQAFFNGWMVIVPAFETFSFLAYAGVI